METPDTSAICDTDNSVAEHPDPSPIDPGASLPRLISVGGASRSGSTLLSLLLGRLEGSVVVGELRYLWSRGYRQNMLCGCGEPFRDCPFWREVVERVYGSFDTAPANELDALQSSVAQIWDLPTLVSPVRTAAADRRIERYLEHLRAICEAIRDVAGMASIVDTSKLPSYCVLLATASGSSSRFVHLVRDSRAVAFSFQRKRAKPDIHWMDASMKQFSPLKSAVDWNGLNLGMELVAATSADVIRVRYEDLVADPGTTLGAIARLPTNHALAGDHVDVDIHHTVSGNPLRFTRGPLTVRLDAEWSERMNRRDRRVVTAATAPLLLRYGYALA